MCASKRQRQAKKRAESKQRQLEEAEMEPKGKKRPRDEEEAITPKKKKGKGDVKKIQPQERRPEEEGASPSLEDYNIPTSERTELLTNLQGLLEVDHVSPTFWACCQLSDIGALKRLVNTAKANPSIVLAFDGVISDVPTLCKLPDF